MVFQFFQKLGKSFMLPIAVLPAAGIILAIGREDVFNIPFIHAAGNAIFANLALIFAMGVAIGISKDGNGLDGVIWSDLLFYFVSWYHVDQFDQQYGGIGWYFVRTFGRLRLQ